MREKCFEWNLHSLKQGENKFHLSINPAELGINNGIVDKKIECNIILYRDGPKVTLQGTLSFILTLECARCLERFEQEKQEKLLVFFLNKEISPGREKENLLLTDTQTEYYENETINISKVFYDTISISIPIKPLCKPDCKGLCPTCGVNRNIEQCNCKKEEIDPRWAPLKKLLKNKK